MTEPLSVNLLTLDEITDLCVKVGFKVRQAQIAAAIACCETPPPFETDEPMANFAAVGDLDLMDATWGASYGGFQIRSLKAEKGTGSFRDEDLLVRPRFNCRAALWVKQNQGFTAWSRYKDDSYKALLPSLFPPAPGTYPVAPGDTLSKIGEKLGIPWETIAAKNKIEAPYRLSLGWVLLLP